MYTKFIYVFLSLPYKNLAPQVQSDKLYMTILEKANTEYKCKK